jgi:aerobic carbon-monoxide dehydrogenase medium subunit
MKPAPFAYIAPESLPEALAATAEYGYEAKLLAGGQSLIPMMNFRLAQPAVLIDLNRLPDLDEIRQENGRLRLGAMVRQSQLENQPLVAQVTPLLHEAIDYVAHPQIRNRGTLGGNLAHADPASELPVVCVALNGRFRLQSTNGSRWVNAVDFFQGTFVTALTPEEILVEIELPALPPRTGWAFLELARRHGDYAQAGVAVVISAAENNICTAARLVYLNVGEMPVVARQAAQALVGQPLTDAAFTAAADIAAEQEIDPVDDIQATAAYKRHLAQVLTVRALRQAKARLS